MFKNILFYCCFLFRTRSHGFTPDSNRKCPIRHARSSFYTTTMLHAKAWKKMRLDEDHHMPELIVLDQLNPKKTPRAKKDIHLFPEIPLVFRAATDHPSPPQWAIASRAQTVDWAWQLLTEFEWDSDPNDHNVPYGCLADYFPPEYIQIYGGSKKRHLQELREVSGIPYHKMVFFDDWTVNLQEVAQLGVLSCHCPNGLNLDIFRSSLKQYHSLKEQYEDNNWMGYII
jgi:magnesium-dependent phosphatase-1